MGGAETLSETLVAGLEDITTTVVTQSVIAGHFESTAARIRLFEEAGLDAPYDYRPLNAVRYAAFVAKVTAEERPDAVLAIMHAASIFLALASIRNPLLLRTIRRVGSVHGHISQYFQMLGRGPTIAERLYLRLMVARLHRIVVPSTGVKDDLARLLPQARSNVQVIYNGIDIASVVLRSRKFSWPASASYRLVMAARLSPQKDHATLLRAFAKLCESHRAELILLGEGEERPSLQRLAAALGIEARVTFAGQLDNPYPVIASADVFVLSSHFEGFGLAIVEAMALGRAVVATDCPSGPGEIIRDGVDGYLVPPEDPELLFQKLKYLLEHGDVRAAVGLRAQQRCQDFSKSRMLDNYRRSLFQ